MPIVVLCSTGLPAAERRAIEQAISLLDDVMYHGDLTDRTTHLVATKIPSPPRPTRHAPPRATLPRLPPRAPPRSLAPSLTPPSPQVGSP